MESADFWILFFGKSRPWQSACVDTIGKQFMAWAGLNDKNASRNWGTSEKSTAPWDELIGELKNKRNAETK